MILCTFQVAFWYAYVNLLQELRTSSSDLEIEFSEEDDDHILHGEQDIGFVQDLFTNENDGPQGGQSTDKESEERETQVQFATEEEKDNVKGRLKNERQRPESADLVSDCLSDKAEVLIGGILDKTVNGLLTRQDTLDDDEVNELQYYPSVESTNKSAREGPEKFETTAWPDLEEEPTEASVRADVEKQAQRLPSVDEEDKGVNIEQNEDSEQSSSATASSSYSQVDIANTEKSFKEEEEGQSLLDQLEEKESWIKPEKTLAVLQSESEEDHLDPAVIPVSQIEEVIDEFVAEAQTKVEHTENVRADQLGEKLRSSGDDDHDVDWEEIRSAILTDTADIDAMVAREESSPAEDDTNEEIVAMAGDAGKADILIINGSEKESVDEYVDTILDTAKSDEGDGGGGRLKLPHLDLEQRRQRKRSHFLTAVEVAYGHHLLQQLSRNGDETPATTPTTLPSITETNGINQQSPPNDKTEDVGLAFQKLVDTVMSMRVSPGKNY